MINKIYFFFRLLNFNKNYWCYFLKITKYTRIKNSRNIYVDVNSGKVSVK